MRSRIRVVAYAALLSAAVLARPSSAELLGTQDAIDPQGPRERVLAIAQRPEIAQQLEALGIPPAQVEERVNAMSDAEVQALAGKLQAAPAGGNLTTTELLLIIILVVLIAILI